MSPPKRLLALVAALISIWIITPGCRSGSTDSDAPKAVVNSEELTTASEYPKPALAQEEGPLAAIPRVPTVMIVAARQSQAELATFLYTTPADLQYVNPRLPDPVPPGMLVVIPPVHRSEGETLVDVAEKTGLNLELLQSMNLSIDPNEVVEEGRLVAVPPRYIVLEDTPLGAAAAALGTDDNTLLSANPAQVGNDEILAGTVLVVPPGTTDSE